MKKTNQRLEIDLENFKKLNVFLQEQLAEKVQRNHNMATQNIATDSEKPVIQNQMEPKECDVSFFYSIGRNSVE